MTQRLFRDLIRDIVPPWLQETNAYALLYTFALVGFDDQLDMCFAAVGHKFPGLISFDGLALTGRERGLIRGLFETDARYSDRLIGWIESWKRRGSPQELVRQLRAYHAPELSSIQIVYRNGTRYVSHADGTLTRDQIAWNPDARPDLWCRIHVYIKIGVYHAAEPDRRRRALDDLKRLIADFTPAHCGVAYTILGNDSDTWSVSPPPTPDTPVASWSSAGTWSDAGGAVDKAPITEVVQDVS